MEVGNGILISDGKQWSFENQVADHFDEHVKLSVHLYEQGHEL
ncbi:MAG: cytochrome P450 [Streptococcaceae bacterium]|nr:cytochrome P450 [Streptococcaceae bacterium]